ncbi:hypothetical protein Pst134EA_002888 [Puccinia striiformis f. sp. tritici]|nr:hypothetical protein Pst134EA_002888 [Puccinia striiformis f. sp. tritici]KAH9464441.1 hypothetical protein Pst134EB_003974 [Puccinia striiformis f. sp. tritici]KAH9472265.1 hypothetical protein Pst134EA_002888 [Puccinia striiformis f. sp. tritici]POW04478.1 hypothetical protein PSTT_10387 [Puccinia striiformis]
MILPPHSIYLCITWHVLAGRLALSSLNAEAHAAMDSANRLPGFAHINTRGAIVIQRIETNGEKQGDHDSGIPEELAERKAELKSMEMEGNQLKNQIRSLSVPGISAPSLQVKSQLEELYDVLMTPIQDRIFRLSGLGSSTTSVTGKTSTETPEHATSALIPSSNSRDLAITQILDDENLPTTTSRDRRSTSPKSLKAHVDAIGISLEKLGIQSSRIKGELDGVELEHVKDILDHERRKIWTSLETKLINFESWSPRWRRTPVNQAEMEFKLEFLRSLFLLGDFIHKYKLLSAKSFDKIKLFNVECVLANTQSYTELLLYIEGNKFFDEAETVIPQIDFITTSPTFKHFHRSIKALPTQYHIYLVYGVLQALTYHGPRYFDDSKLEASYGFSHVCEGFREPQFLVGAQHLAERLTKTPELDYRADEGDLQRIDLIEDLIDFFQDPPRTSLSDQERLEFQLIFYVLDFVDKYYQPIIEAMERRQELRLLFRKQLEYMRSYLKFHQTRSRDPVAYSKSVKQETFSMMFNDKSRENEDLRQWIRTVPLALFHQNSWLDRLGFGPLDCFGFRRPPNLNLWMGEKP